MDSEFFIRIFEITAISDSLKLYQKTEGDVSCVVWDASIVLAKYLEKKFSENADYLKNKEILELGAGLGCVGLTVACFGASVVSTDLPECVPLLDFNITKNKTVWSKYGKIKSLALSWGHDDEVGFIPDVIILADCIYYEEVLKPKYCLVKR